MLYEILTTSKHRLLVPVQDFTLSEAKHTSVLWRIAVHKSDVAAAASATPCSWPSVDYLHVSLGGVAGTAVQMRLWEEDGSVHDVAAGVLANLLCVVDVRAKGATDVKASPEVAGGALPPEIRAVRFGKNSFILSGELVWEHGGDAAFVPAVD